MTKIKLNSIIVLLLLCACCIGLTACNDASVNIDYYDILVDRCENGTVYVASKGNSVIKATAGETLFVTAVPDTGYKLDEVFINGVKQSEVRFTMPRGDVNVKATFVAVGGSISVVQSDNGTISVDKQTANYGDTITVTVKPATGYKLKARSLRANYSEIFKGSVSEETQIVFDMPDGDVTITAEFEIAFDLVIDSWDKYKSFADDVNAGNTYKGKTILLTADIGDANNPMKARIGNSSTHRFEGIFDGQGHKVYLQMSLKNSVGMFGYVSGATIRNVEVYGNVMRTTDGGAAGGIVGAVVSGNGEKTTIVDCINYATVTAKKTLSGAGGNDAGGIVGVTTGNLEILRCQNNGEIVAENVRAGGIVARINQKNQGKVGYIVTVDIKECRNLGDVTADKSQGVIVGEIVSETTESGTEMSTVYISVYNNEENIIGTDNTHDKAIIVILDDQNTAEEETQR